MSKIDHADIDLSGLSWLNRLRVVWRVVIGRPFRLTPALSETR